MYIPPISVRGIMRSVFYWEGARLGGWELVGLSGVGGGGMRWENIGKTR